VLYRIIAAACLVLIFALMYRDIDRRKDRFERQFARTDPADYKRYCLQPFRRGFRMPVKSKHRAIREQHLSISKLVWLYGLSGLLAVGFVVLT